MVIVPVPFQIPPPSRAALLPLTVPPVIVDIAGSGDVQTAAVAGRALRLALIIAQVTLVSVTPKPAPELSSMPPPARLAVLPVMEEPSRSACRPTSFKIPPPLPDVPLARLLVIDCARFGFTAVPPALNTPPPP